MYSPSWFETFATAVPSSVAEAELAGIMAVLPLPEYRRVLDVGCGIGRVAGPLSARGYDVVGVDVSVDALVEARRRAPRPRYIALDQREVACLRTAFDSALILWNSLGFVDRTVDHQMLAGLGSVVRRGGRVILDLYHPGWLRLNERSGEPDQRGARVRRWMRGGRCFHEIRYPSGEVDEMAFEVYEPVEIRDLCRCAGLDPTMEMVWWKEVRPSAEFPRYQLVATVR